MPLSQSTWLLWLATAMGTIPLAFGLLFMYQPSKAASFFEFPPVPTVSAVDKTVEGFAILYAVRDIYWGLTIYLTAYFGSRKALGWILVAGSGVAAVDGWMCAKYVGGGEWNHWGYAPLLTVLGGCLAGWFDF